MEIEFWDKTFWDQTFWDKNKEKDSVAKKRKEFCLD